MPHRRTYLWLLVLAAGGCGLPDGLTRGFDSRQILEIRDSQLDLGGFTQGGSKVYLIRYVQPVEPVGYLPPHDLSTVDLTTAETRAVAPAVIRTRTLVAGPQPGDSGSGRSLALVHYPSDADVPSDYASIDGPKPGRLQLAIVDERTDERVDISDVADQIPMIMGPSDSNPIAVGRFDAADDAQVWFGPPEALQAAPLVFSRVLGFDATGAFGLATVPTIDWADVQHIPFDGSNRTVIVAPYVGEHLAIPDESDVAVIADPASGSPRNAWYWCVPGDSPEQLSRCFFVYVRTVINNGPSRLFVRATDEAREVVLPGVLDGLDAFQGPKTLIWTAGGSTGNRLYSWNFGADRATGCDVSPGQIRGYLWSQAQDRFAAYIAAVDSQGRRLPGNLALGAPGGPCRVIAPDTSQFSFWTFSADGAVLDWHEVLAAGSVVHLTATDGSGERRIDLPGTVFGSELRGAHRLLLRRDTVDGVTLSFIDLAEEPVHERVIADRIADRVSWVWITDSWLLLGDARSRQDDTFTLRALNIDTGESRLVSSSVVAFSTPWRVRPEGATTLPVAYLVRGRAPSSQDGIWLARLDLDDFGP